MQTTVILDDKEWQQVVALIAAAPAPWAITNPLLMAIGAQVNKAGTNSHTAPGNPDEELIRVPERQ